jgi:hypothetical protein
MKMCFLNFNLLPVFGELANRKQNSLFWCCGGYIPYYTWYGWQLGLFCISKALSWAYQPVNISDFLLGLKLAYAVFCTSNYICHLGKSLKSDWAKSFQEFGC